MATLQPLQRAKGDGGLFHEITHIDCDTGHVSSWDAGFGNGVSEPVFVEKNASSKEGEGWLLATVYDSKASTSSMVILDAQAVSDGPWPWQAGSSHPYGFHGSWRNN